MQTSLADFIVDTPIGQQADSILRNCVHCGFCNATCPTYQLLGDELDGPRGRIYLIKQVLEGQPASATTRTHLDRCLTCRNCETTCPSGVEYGRLVDIGRRVVEQQAPRGPVERSYRALLRQVFANGALFSLLMRTGLALKPLLPSKLAAMLHAPRPAGEWPQHAHARRMIVLRGCVQPALAPRVNAAAARVLGALGIQLEEVAGDTCCGALDQHMSAPDVALAKAKRNIDAWCAELDAGAETIVMTASGCGAMVREYGHLLADNPSYAERAQRVVEHTRDLSEVIAAEALDTVNWNDLSQRRIAYHAPCTLQHGQKLPGSVERILTQLGVTLVAVRDSHFCCGSAGTYSVLQPKLAGEFRTRKLANLEAGEPDEILTANVGCMHHLQAGSQRDVRHWIELLDDALPN